MGSDKSSEADAEVQSHVIAASPDQVEEQSGTNVVGRCGLLARFAIWLIRQYQRFLSPIFGGQCRFYPSCSQYGILAIQKHGALLGSLKTIWRICRCQPFCAGGVDYP